MDRLTLPKQTSLPEDGSLNAGIPPGTLPRCAALPLDAKLPMVAGPKGSVVLFTTNLGEKIHVSSQELDFDLTDPYSLLMSNGYKPLHDPHLKLHIKAPCMRRRLRKGGFITRDGKVLCTLKEFNEWRQYLRKIHLALERRKEEQREEGGRQGRHQDASATSLSRLKEERVREVRERINKQLEEDKLRYQEIVKEEEARVQRMREEQLAKQSEKEKKYQTLQERRVSLVMRRQAEERRRKMHMMQKWMTEDARRVALLEARHKERETQLQRKLEQSWEMRKTVQQRHLEAEQARRAHAELMKDSRITERERLTQIKKDEHEAKFAEMTSQRRIERERTEEEYAQRFAQRLERRLQMAAKKKRGKKKGTNGRVTIPTTGRRVLKSNWDIERSLLQSFSDDEQERSGREDVDMVEDEITHALTSGDESLTTLTKPATFGDEMICQSASRLGLGDFHGATFNEEVLAFGGPESMEQGEDEEVGSKEDPDEEILASMPAHRDLADQQSAGDTGVSLEDLASCIVSVSTYIASKVLLPAIVQYQEELEQDTLRPKTPLPTGSAADLTSPASTSSISEAAPGRRGVRFSLVEDTIAIDDFKERENDMKSIQEYSMEEMEYESDADDDDLQTEDSFTMMVQGRDSLTKMRRLSMDVQPGMPIPGIPAIAPMGHLPESSTETLTVDEDEVASPSSSMSEQAGVSSMASMVDGRDSLTKLRTMSMTMQSDDYSTTAAPPATLSGMLKKILTDFNSGKLTSEQVRRLMTVATEIIQGASGLVLAPTSSRDSLSSVASSSSAVADEIVRQTLSKVKNDLFNTYGPSFGQPESLAHQHASANALANIIVEKALTMAAAAVLKFSDQVLGPEVTDPNKISSIPKLPEIASAEKFDKSATLGSGTSIRSGLSLTSGTSVYVQDVLQRIVADLETDRPLETRGLVAEHENASARKVSTTSNFIESMLNRVMGSTQPSFPLTPKVSVETSATSSGTLTEVVLGTLEHVVKEIKLRAPESSSTTHLIASILNQAAAEIRNVAPHMLPQKGGSGNSLDSQASVVSQYIRNTLTSACTEVETQYQGQMKGKSVTSLFAEELVCDTLDDCLQKIRSGKLSNQELGKLTAAILTAQEDISGGASLQQSPRISDDFGSRSSSLMDQLIQETLCKIQKMISQGSISNSDVTEIANTLNERRFSSQEQESPPISETTKLANAAKFIVNDAIAKVLQNIQLTNAHHPICGTDSSQDTLELVQNTQEVQMIVDDAITNVLKGIRVEFKQSYEPRPLTATSDDSKDALEIVEQTLHQLASGLPTKEERSASSASATAHEMNNSQCHRSSNSLTADQSENTGTDTEAGVHPTINGELVDIDQEVINETLIAISAKHPTLATPQEASERNSFLNLTKPEIGNISSIDSNSNDSVKRSLLTMSSKTLALRGSKLMAQVPASIPVPKDSVPKVKSEMIRSHIQKIDLAEEEEEIDTESDDSDEGRLVSVYESSNNAIKKSSDAIKSTQKKSEEKAVSSLPVVTTTSKVTSVKKQSSSTSPRPSRGSLIGRSKTEVKTSTSKSGTKSTVSTPSKGSVHGASGVKPSKVQSTVSRKHTSEKTVKTSSKDTLKTAGVERIKSLQMDKTSSPESISSPMMPTSSSEPCAKPRSSVLLHPRKKSSDTLPCRDSLDEDKKDEGSSTQVTSLCGTHSSVVQVRASDTDTSSVASVEQKTSKQRKSSDRLQKSGSGKTVEMTSSGTHKQLKGSPKTSDTSTDSVGAKTKSSHKSINMTPRPSSAFAKTSGKRAEKKSSSSIKCSMGSTGSTKDACDDADNQRGSRRPSTSSLPDAASGTFETGSVSHTDATDSTRK